ncbi:hypothetical protein EOD39_16761 [Acipenser ruthenus]|uniref:Uncharacterized protein n=1 Tax=Acipenser ruthenus TaxID=7906 RepID=A0A444U8S9_ACIRT|nr:hypothetical protein EOD39_16761 [Acipenser ruthenus]
MPLEVQEELTRDQFLEALGASELCAQVCLARPDTAGGTRAGSGKEEHVGQRVFEQHKNGKKPTSGSPGSAMRGEISQDGPTWLPEVIAFVRVVTNQDQPPSPLVLELWTPWAPTTPVHSNHCLPCAGK